MTKKGLIDSTNRLLKVSMLVNNIQSKHLKLKSYWDSNYRYVWLLLNGFEGCKILIVDFCLNQEFMSIKMPVKACGSASCYTRECWYRSNHWVTLLRGWMFCVIHCWGLFEYGWLTWRGGSLCAVPQFCLNRCCSASWYGTGSCHIEPCSRDTWDSCPPGGEDPLYSKS